MDLPNGCWWGCQNVEKAWQMPANSGATNSAGPTTQPPTKTMRCQLWNYSAFFLGGRCPCATSPDLVQFGWEIGGLENWFGFRCEYFIVRKMIFYFQFSGLEFWGPLERVRNESKSFHSRPNGKPIWFWIRYEAQKESVKKSGKP